MVIRAERKPPIEAAAEARQALVTAVQTGVPTDLELTHQEAACLLTLPTEVLKRHFSALIETSPERVTIKEGSARDVALEAIHSWEKDKNPEISRQFAGFAYPLLYTGAQAANKWVGEGLMDFKHGLLLDALGGIPKYNALKGLRTLIAARRTISDEDKIEISGILHQLWTQMGEEYQNSMGGLLPENVFQE